jgi:hypothetical protein
VTLVTAGSRSLTVTDTSTGSLTATQGGFVVIAAAADHFLIEVIGSVTSGTPFSLKVSVVDAYGNVVTDYAGTIHFQVTDPDTGVVLPGDYTFSASDKGVHTFAVADGAGLVLKTKGDQTLTITDDSGLSSSLVIKVN